MATKEKVTRSCTVRTMKTWWRRGNRPFVGETRSQITLVWTFYYLFIKTKAKFLRIFQHNTETKTAIQFSKLQPLSKNYLKQYTAISWILLKHILNTDVIILSLDPLFSLECLKLSRKYFLYVLYTVMVKISARIQTRKAKLREKAPLRPLLWSDK